MHGTWISYENAKLRMKVEFLNGWGRGNISRVDCSNGCTQIWGGANSTKVEQLTFGGDCRGGCMHNQGCENKGAITIL